MPKVDPDSSVSQHVSRRLIVIRDGWWAEGAWGHLRPSSSAARNEAGPRPLPVPEWLSRGSPGARR